MGIFRSFAGTVRIELTSADVRNVTRRLNEKQIELRDFQIINELTVRFTIPYRHLKEVQRTAEKQGDEVSIIKRIGLFRTLLGLKERPVFVCGMAMILALTILLPKRVLFIQVEGNERIPDNRILEAAVNSGVGFGAIRRDIRSEKVKNLLLDALPELQWAGVNTYGCNAVIAIRERTAETERPAEYPVTEIVAAYDGVITSCTATAGTALCMNGQAVQKGDILISGYTDCGNIVIVGRAEGEVFARTTHEKRAVTPKNYFTREKLISQKTNYRLRIGKKEINFYKGSGIYDSSCVKMVSWYGISLPGGYTLPVTLIKETLCAYQVITCELDRTDAERNLAEYLQTYLRSDGIARAITDAQVSFETDPERHCLTGVYSCVEMIGREQAEQIGDFHGKTD